LFPESRTSRGALVPAWTWLAPALTCVLLALVVVRQDNGSGNGIPHQPVVNLASSNFSSSASFSNDFERAGSNLPASSFELTNRSSATSNLGVGAWLPVKLN
jgi:hypothetical protein